jgi:hypothetical protein
MTFSCVFCVITAKKKRKKKNIKLKISNNLLSTKNKFKFYLIPIFGIFTFFSSLPFCSSLPSFSTFYENLSSTCHLDNLHISCIRAMFRRKKYSSNANCYLCAASPSSTSCIPAEHRALTEERRSSGP